MNQNSSLIASTSSIQLRAAGAEAMLIWAEPYRIASTTRLSLSLEQIRGSYDAAILKVYLQASEEIFLGSVGLYGLRRASAGMTSHLETPSEALAFFGPAAAAGTPLRLSVRPHEPLPDGVEITIECIGLYIDGTA